MVRTLIHCALEFSYQGSAVFRSNTDVLAQVLFHNGVKFRRPRRTDQSSRSRTLPLLLSAIHRIILGSHAAVGLALTVAEEAVVVVQKEAEVDEVVEHRPHTQMAHARRPRTSQLLLLNLTHGRQPLPLPLTILGTLPSRLRKAGVLPPLKPQLQLLRQLIRPLPASSPME